MQQWRTDFDAYQREEAVRRVDEAKANARRLAESAGRRSAERRHYREIRAGRAGHHTLTQFLQAEEEAASRHRARAAFVKQTEDALRAATEARQSDEARLKSTVAKEIRLKAALKSVRRARLALEARVESAVAEETRLKELLSRGETNPAEEPESSSKGKEKAGKNRRQGTGDGGAHACPSTGEG